MLTKKEANENLDIEFYPLNLARGVGITTVTGLKAPLKRLNNAGCFKIGLQCISNVTA
jgi:hypothetical protein